MRVRSWLIRGLILAGVAVLAALAWVANSWISPERVREQVVLTLSEQLDGVDIHVGSARMRILGGIAVSDLRLTRRGDPPDRPFLVVPRAIVYHDKEQLNHGRLVIRKVEMDGPAFRLERSAGGEWNVDGVVRPGPADAPIPQFVVKNGTVTVIDRAPGALPPVTLTDVQCTLLNDPRTMLTVTLTAASEKLGTVSVRGRLNRINNHAALSVELGEVPLGEAAVPVAKRFAPELAPHLAKLTATAKVKAELIHAPGATPPWRHDVQFEVKGAKFEHPDVPWPVEKIAATVRSVDGRVTVNKATAQIGQAKVELSLKTRADPNPAAAGAGRPADDPLRKIEDNLQEFDITATGVALNDELFKRLPDKLKRVPAMFSPTGNADLGYKFTREGAGWRRELELRPKQAGMTYEKFRYPVSDVRGLVKKTVTHTGGDNTAIDLVGTAAGQLVTVKGTLDGAGDDPAISLSVTGSNVPLDASVYAALPPQYAAVIRKFNATARGDFLVKVTQKANVNLCEKEFRIDIKDGAMNYALFPYPMEKLKGRLVVRSEATDPKRPVRPGEPTRPLPDRDEIVFDGFTAVHAKAPLWMHGAKRPSANGRDQKLILHIGGSKVPLDAELKQALATAKVDTLWDTLAPRGKVTFEADVEVMDRAPAPESPNVAPPLDPANDIRLALRFSGPTATPKFFPYEMTELSGRMEYVNNRLAVADLAAWHGPSRVKLGKSEVLFYPNGTVWAKLEAIELKPLVFDEALKKALPGKIGPAVESLQLKGGAELHVKKLVVLTPPDSPAVVQAQAGGGGKQEERPDAIVYWDAELKLLGASLDTGVPWEDAYGTLACAGKYEGTHLGLVCGNVWVERALVSRVPLNAATCRVRAEPQQPDPARPGQFLPTTLQMLNVTGDLFQGAIGGQARVVLTEPTRYEVWVTVTDSKLEEAAKHYKLGSDSDLKGVAQAQLLIYNRPDPKTGQLVVEGSGKLDVPSGRMYNLPIMLDLMKVLKGSAPDKTAFEQAHAVFRIRGDRIRVEQLDLIGKAVCVGGTGELDTTGDYVKFEFYTMLSKVLWELPDPVGDLTAFVSKNLFTIKLTRENGELKFRSEPVPLVTEPTRAIVKRLKRGAERIVGK